MWFLSNISKDAKINPTLKTILLVLKHGSCPLPNPKGSTTPTRISQEYYVFFTYLDSKMPHKDHICEKLKRIVESIFFFTAGAGPFQIFGWNFQLGNGLEAFWLHT